MRCGSRREARRRWCWVQLVLVGVRILERHLSLRGGHGEGCDVTCSWTCLAGWFGYCSWLLAPKPDCVALLEQSMRKPCGFNKLFIYFIWVKCIWLSATKCSPLLLRLSYSGQELVRTHSLLLFSVIWCPSDLPTGCERILILNFI